MAYFQGRLKDLRKKSKYENMEQIWKDHPLGFKVSNQGEVFGFMGRKVGYPRKDGYREVRYKRGRRLIHRLVWEAFNGPVPSGMEINHIDMIKSNNHIDNLEILSHKDNLRHAYRTGLGGKNAGERNPKAKLTVKDVLEIRRIKRNGILNQRELGERFGVSHRTISLLVNNKIWKNV